MEEEKPNNSLMKFNYNIESLINIYSELKIDASRSLDTTSLLAIGGTLDTLKRCQTLEKNMKNKTTKKKILSMKPEESSLISKLDPIKLIYDLLENDEKSPDRQYYPREFLEKTDNLKAILKNNWHAEPEHFGDEEVDVRLKFIFELENLDDKENNAIFENVKLVEVNESTFTAVDDFLKIVPENFFAENLHNLLKQYNAFADSILLPADAVILIYQKYRVKIANNTEMGTMYGMFLQKTLKYYSLEKCIRDKYNEFKNEIAERYNTPFQLNRGQKLLLASNYAKTMLNEIAVAPVYLSDGLQYFLKLFDDVNSAAKRSYGPLLMMKCLFLGDKLDEKEKMANKNHAYAMEFLGWNTLSHDLTNYKNILAEKENKNKEDAKPAE